MTEQTEKLGNSKRRMIRGLMVALVSWSTLERQMKEITNRDRGDIQEVTDGARAKGLA